MNATDPLRLRCPKCTAAVRASAALAGKRVKCPKCGGAIKVPGAAQAPDDNDWLSLDDPLPSAAPGGGEAKAKSRTDRDAAAHPVAPGPPPTPAPAPAPSGDDGNDWLDDWSEASDAAGPLAAAGSSPTAGSGGSPADLPPLSEDDWTALDSVGGFAANDSGEAGAAVPRKDATATAVAASEYRAKCPICDAVHYVRPKQAGKSLRCGDCYSDFVVPPPPKAVAKVKIDLERAATFRLSEVEGVRDPHGAPGAKSAAEYLRAAEDAETDEEIHSRYENPDVSSWLRGIFGIFTDPSVAAYWLALALLGSIPGVLAVLTGNPMILLGTAVLSLLYGAFVLICGFAILEAVAGGERRIDEWPAFSPIDWFGPCITTLVALALSGLPGAMLAVPIFGMSLVTVGLVLFSIYLMFPFVLLSMLDNGSVLMPASTDVSRSVTRCKEAWGTLYFSAALLFFFYFLATAVLTLTPPVVSVFFGCVFFIGFVFVYFSMIGQLAFSIGQAVNAGPEDEE